jgi:putative component of membrane protein insertase Oxa1/YidC/SpoIIIJ protein YidD
MSSRAILVFLSTAILFSWTAAISENSYDILLSETPLHRQDHALLSFYQQKLSVHGGARCRLYPTCSAFYREALDRYGAFWATLMLLDRILYREHGRSLEEYPVSEDGELHMDPVYKNYIMNREGYYR